MGQVERRKEVKRKRKREKPMDGGRADAGMGERDQAQRHKTEAEVVKIQRST